jgi:hypothetical protein
VSARLKVIDAPIFDTGGGQRDLTVPHGLTIAAIVKVAVPDGAEQPRVYLATKNGLRLAPPEEWHHKPRKHTKIVIRAMTPKGDNLKGILSILVSVAAAALGQFYLGPMLAGTLGLGQGFWTAATTLALNFTGGLLLNAIFPAKTAGNDNEKPTFAISSLKNAANPDGPLPRLHGKLRVAPVWGVRPYTEVVGGDLYYRAVVLWGHGPLSITDETLKIGDTPFSKYDEIDWKTRPGRPDDAPLEIVTKQVIERLVGAELTRQLPRDDKGDVIDGPAEDKPVARFSAVDSKSFSGILGFTNGLIKIDKKGKENATDVVVRRRQRLEGLGEWQVLDDIIVREKKKKAFYRQFTWDFPTRGRWEVEFNMMTPERRGKDTTFINTCTWVALQSIRPEYPFNFGNVPVAMTELRIKATAQLNGPLDEVNGVPSTIALDYVPAEDPEAEGTWIEQETAWPPAQAILALKGKANAFPTTDSFINYPAFADWHRFCVAKGLRYHRYHDFAEPLGSTLKSIGAAGRAVIKPVEGKWTVIIDQPRPYARALINARNSSQMKMHKILRKRPDALRVPFRDQDNGWGAATRIVPWPGFVGTPQLIEERAMPWCTDAAQAYVETRRFMHESDLRDCRYSAIQAGAVRSARPGDRVDAAMDMFSGAPASMRVRTVRGNLVEFDVGVTMEADASYAIEFLVFSAEDPKGYVVMRTVARFVGQTRAIRLAGEGEKPSRNTIVHFGPVGETSMELILVTPVERGKNGSTVLNFLPAAREIDELTDADAAAIPPWNGRVGAELGSSDVAPAVPVFSSVETGTDGTGNVNGLRAVLEAGRGSTAIVDRFDLFHRLAGAGAWSGPITRSAVSSVFDVPGYVFGNSVELQAKAWSVDNVPSDLSPIVPATIGDEDFPPLNVTFNFSQARNLPLIL